HAVIPHPRLGIDGLADRTEQAQPREIVPGRQGLAELHERTDRSRRGVEHGDAVRLAVLPEARAIGMSRPAFVQHDGGAERERPVSDVSVSGDPADIRGAPEHVLIAQVEHPLRGELRSEQIAAGGVLNALRLAGGARGVEQEQRVLRIDPLRLAGRRLALDGVVPPEVALRVHGDRLAGSLEHDDTLDALAVTGRSEEHTSELQSPYDLVCRLLLEKKKKNKYKT